MPNEPQRVYVVIGEHRIEIGQLYGMTVDDNYTDASRSVRHMIDAFTVDLSELESIEELEQAYARFWGGGHV